MLAHLQGQVWNAADLARSLGSKEDTTRRYLDVLAGAFAEKEAYFYKTYSGAELDLLIVRGGKRYGFEFKYADAPRPTQSMHVVIEFQHQAANILTLVGFRATHLS